MLAALAIVIALLIGAMYLLKKYFYQPSASSQWELHDPHHIHLPSESKKQHCVG